MNDSVLENALRLRRAGKLHEAAELYAQILRGNPSHFEALHALGIVCYQTGRLDEAERLIGQAVAVEPRADAIYNRACLLLKLERFEEALGCFGEAIALKPGYIEALTNRGNTLMRLKRYEEARSDLETVIALAPKFAEAWNNLGGALKQLQRYDEAISSYDKALALKPNYSEAWKNRGIVKLVQHLHEQAIRDFDKALELDPRSAETWENRGNALSLISPSDAIESYSRALAIRGGHADTLFRRGNSFHSLRRFEESAADYRRGLKIDPDYPYASGNLAFCRLSCCDWQGLDEETTKLRGELHAGKRVLAPFVGIAVGSTPDELLTSAKLWATDECPTASVALWQGQPYAHDRIRLAYLSANFNEHAVARLMVGVFEHHDKARFETTAISFGRNDGPMSERLGRAFDHFVDVRSRGDAEVARLLRDMEIDIAVDLMGFTELCRARILAFRPAPVQVNYLGFPGTMGTRHLDYIIADKMAIHEGEQAHYSENVVFLPNCYLPNDSTRPIAARTPSRREAGLPDDGFVFCSFNQAYKFAPAMFDIWMRLLKRTEGSILWLPECAAAAMRNLKAEALKRDVAPERIVFAPFAPSTEDHLARLRLADLFLDTLPYNSHTSACDALWSGVPVVTSPGASFAGRVAASVLLAMGMPDLLAGSLAEYENLAAEFANDPARLAATRAKIERHREVYPLFDTHRFTRNLEAAYTAMWERARIGQAPRSFAVGNEAGPS